MADLGTRFTTEGLVIKEMNVGESDRLVTLFTREHGIIKAFASGAKNIKSKKGAATKLLTYSSFTILNKKGTNRIYEATAISQFFSMGSDLEILSLSQYFCELCFFFGEAEVANSDLLKLILNSLHFITKEKRNPYLIKAITELRIAATNGYMPSLIACENCSQFETDIMYFSLLDGSLSCMECGRRDGDMAINKTILSAMRHIVFSEINKLYSFSIPDEDAKILSDITERYLETQTDQKFQTLEFLNSIKE